ncbi:MAG: hypothetical protein ACE5Q6_21075, partial [Dehalococcoidia bacterium]
KIVHASWWNADKPISQSACLTVTVMTNEGHPVRGVRVNARGVTYAGFSAGWTNQEGRADFRVKRSEETTEQVDVFVYTGYLRPGIPDPAIRVPTPSAESSLPDISACQPVEIKLELEPQLQITAGTLAQGLNYLMGDFAQTALGSVLYVNDNDSDGDGKFDFEDTDGVGGELDVVRLQLSLTPSGTRIGEGTALLSFAPEGNGQGKVKVWETRDKHPGTELTLPVELELNRLPLELYVEGIAPSESVRDVVFQLDLGPIGGGPLAAPLTQTSKSSKAALTSLKVVSVRFEGMGNSATDTDQLDQDPHPNAVKGTYADKSPRAVRVFPGGRGIKKVLSPAKQVVKVKVTLNLPTPGPFRVSLRSLDVDDPSSNKAPVDPNDTSATNTCPGGVAGNCYLRTSIPYTNEEDNRGQVNNKKSGELQNNGRNAENRQGVAPLWFSIGKKESQHDFQVTMQPGDNFRVVAHPSAKFMNQLRNQDRNHSVNIYVVSPLGGTAVKLFNEDDIVSPVLTVWRFLNLELDSMVRPTFQNNVVGRIASLTPVGTTQCRVRLVNFGYFGSPGKLKSLQVNQFVKGTIRVSEAPGDKTLLPKSTSHTVISNTGNSVIIARPAGGCPKLSIFPSFGLHDDDKDTYLPVSPLTNLSQESDDPKKNRLAPGYIRPRHNGGTDPSHNAKDFSFDVNVESRVEVPNVKYYNKRQSNSNIWYFWNIYVLNVFQLDLNLDNDPDTEKSLLGVTGFTIPKGGIQTTRDYVNLAMETYRDLCGDLNPQAGVRDGADAVALHEIGHAFGGEHRRGDSDGGVMTATRCANKSTEFSDATLNKMRSGVSPGTYKVTLRNPKASGF